MSDGPNTIIQRWSSNSSHRENIVFWVKAGVTGFIVGLLGSHLFEYGNLLWEETSWTTFTFFLLYTLCLLLIISHLNQRTCKESSSKFQFTPSYPIGLTRLQSYLAFFPITHIIHHHHSDSCREAGKYNLDSVGNESSTDADDSVLSTRIGAQLDMAIDAIISEYVCPWYTKISDDRYFLDQCKTIIQAVFAKLGEKLRQVDRNDFAKEAIQIIHVHWKEYTDALRKTQQSQNGEDVLRNFKFVHTFLQDNKDVSKRYQYLVSKVVEDLAIPDLRSAVVCHFLGGILVKNFILFYVDMLCQPSWINGSLISLLLSGNMSVDITGTSSQNSSSPASPLPEPSPKTPNLFGDDAMECASIDPSSTAGSTPTKKSTSSSGHSVSQEEFSARSEQNETKHFFESVSSIDDGSSSEPKTESSESARPSPIEPRFQPKADPNVFHEPFVLTKRPRNLSPLKPLSPMITVSTALGSVIRATALPLLPSECYTDENTFVLPKYCKPLTKFDSCRQVAQESSICLVENDVADSRNVSDSESETSQSPKLDEEKVLPIASEQLQNDESPTNGSKQISSHYYSFDEACKPKAASTSFFDTCTLSLDGGIDRKLSCKDQLQLCSHEYKTEAGKPNRSPVYEEPEDFAASIAKLRSLLEQKERKSSTPPPGEDGDVFESPSPPPTTISITTDKQLPENITIIPQISEPCTSEPQTATSSASSVEYSKASSFTFNEPILTSEINSTIVEPIERSNYDSVPEIKCCFRNVIIPKVENSADAGGQYMFYCIQYEGVYYDEDQPQKIVHRTTTIKRKFKEFLTLQAHLEENTTCKPHLKGIKTPTRWLNVSLTKSDATVAHQRRTMLEKYLQQLCYHPVIGFCQELMIFMAYGEDGFCSFEVGDPKDLLSHRLDKLAKKFTGVINSLKDALPSFELDLSPAPNTPKSEGITPCDLKSESSFPSFPFQEHFSQHPRDKATPLDDAWVNKLSEWNSEIPGSPKENDEKSNGISTDLAFQPEIDVVEGSIFSAYPLAASVTRLLCDVLWLPQYRPHPASVATFMSISGKSLENYVVESMDIFLSEEAILGYLEWLTITINNGQSETDSRCDLSSEIVSEQDLKTIVKRRIPAWVRWMWGRNRLDLTIDRITGLFQNSVVNHDLVLSLGELLFSKMVIVDENNAE